MKSSVSRNIETGLSGDYVIPQNWAAYSAVEHRTWDLLFARQATLLNGRVTEEFMRGLAILDLGEPGIPIFEALNERLYRATGWQVVAVPDLVPDAVFFAHLANRRFPAGRFIRKPEQMDYLAEPDIFHDVFGHVPLLADPIFADYMQAYGQGGLRSLKYRSLDHLARLYWYTVEFGLIQTDAGLRIYGAGIASSKGESIFALEDPSPNRIAFDLMRVMRTQYRIDAYQQSYFVIPSFEQLMRETVETDFAPLYEALADLPDIPADALLNEDQILHRGSQDYAQQKRQIAV